MKMRKKSSLLTRSTTKTTHDFSHTHKILTCRVSCFAMKVLRSPQNIKKYIAEGGTDEKSTVNLSKEYFLM